MEREARRQASRYYEFDVREMIIKELNGYYLKWKLFGIPPPDPMMYPYMNFAHNLLEDDSQDRYVQPSPSSNRYFNLRGTLEKINRAAEQPGKDIVSQLLAKLYNLYNDARSPQVQDERYNILCFAQYCLDQPPKKLQYELCINTKADVDEFIEGSDIGFSVNNVTGSSPALHYIRRVEYQLVHLNVRRPHLFYDIENAFWLHIFDNIENRLQAVGLFFNWDVFVCVIREVGTNNIWKICDSECVTEYKGLVDILVVNISETPAELHRMRIRSLMYTGHNTILNLSHPQHLVTLHIDSTEIPNLSECVNLKNISASECIFTESHFKGLKKIVRFHFWLCTFWSPGHTFVEFITKLNNIEYAGIDECKNFFKIPNFVGRFPALRHLYFKFKGKDDPKPYIIDEKGQLVEKKDENSEELGDKHIIIDVIKCQLTSLEFLNTRNCTVDLINGETPKLVR